MLSQEYFSLYPSRLLWSGAVGLGSFAILSCLLLFPIADQPIFPLPPRQAAQIAAPQSIQPLQLIEKGQLWDWPVIEESVLISLCPPRPPGGQSQPVAHIQLKGSEQTRRIFVPGRVYLHFNDRGVLCFQDEEGPFWIDAFLEKNHLAARLEAINQGQKIYSAAISSLLGEPPLQNGEEFPAGTPLRSLCEARWWGVDLIYQLKSSGVKQRIEIGPSVFQMGEGDWIAYKDGRWESINQLSESVGYPLAKIRSVSSQRLEWDVWDGSSIYVKLSCPIQAPLPVHAKAEDWLTLLRVGSDRQISCMLEKQCLILRLGDWVLKENGRWRLLRKDEDKQQLIQCKKSGDLFVLETIDSKQKFIKGKIYLANRAQAVPIEAWANAQQSPKRLHASVLHKRKNV